MAGKALGADSGVCATGFTGDPEGLKKIGVTEPDVGAEIFVVIVGGDRDADVGKVGGLDEVNPS